MSEFRLHVFVDESGTNELDGNKQGVSHLFIMVAILVSEENLQLVEAGIRAISSELCNGGEIKSNKIGSNHNRRLKFIEKIINLPFTYHALIINKRLYEEIKKIGGEMYIYADEIGSKEFMNSFESYFRKQGMPDLFANYHFKFTKSHQTPIIQLADLIAGTLSYCFDEVKKCQESANFRDLLRQKEAVIDTWPLGITPIRQGSADDNEIISIALKNRVVEFIKKYEAVDSYERILQCAIIKRLLFAREFEEEKKQTIYTSALIDFLKTEGFGNISKQEFQSRIIGEIRDEGIILTGTNKGFKLALSQSDVYEYLNHNRTVIEPMIARLVKAQSTIKHPFIKQVIFQKEEYSVLKRLMQVFSACEIEKAIKDIKP